MNPDQWAAERQSFFDKMPPGQYLDPMTLAKLQGVSFQRAYRFLEDLVTRGEVKVKTHVRGYFLRYIYMKPLANLPE